MADKDPGAKKRGDNSQFMRALGSMPWLKPIEKERHRTKIFKSGNSLAVRIPAGTALKAGMEMELTVENGQFLSYDPVEAPKRKFNIAKVAGSATSLKLIDDDARLFEERSLDWPDRKV
jgi:antitoxin VapB